MKIVWLASEINGMAGTSLSVIVEQIIHVKATIDCPVVTGAQNVTERGTVSSVRCEDATLALTLAKNSAEIRQIEDRDVFYAKHTVARDGALAWNDVENGALENPPRFWSFAICNKALVENNAALKTICGLALIVKGICCREQARAGDDPGRRCTVYNEELAFFRAKVVFGVVCV